MFFGKHREGEIAGLEILVLNIIKAHSGITGYDIMQKIASKPRGLWSGTAGSIYPILKNLSKKELVRIEEIDKTKRLKKGYHITARGEVVLKDSINDNIFPSMHSLMDYIFTIVDDFPGIKRKVQTMFFNFQYHKSVDHPKINETDLSLQNQHLIENSLKKLKHSKQELTKRIKMIDNRISKFKTVLEVITKESVKKAKNIEILDDDIYS